MENNISKKEYMKRGISGSLCVSWKMSYRCHVFMKQPILASLLSFLICEPKVSIVKSLLISFTLTLKKLLIKSHILN